MSSQDAGIALWVDHREHALIPRFEDSSFPVVVRNLDLGDLHIVVHGSGEECPSFILERKTVTDLAASIQDGRYREQAARLRDGGLPPWRVTYLIEGALSLQDLHSHGRSLVSAVLGLQYREGFHVQFTGTVAGTVRFVQELCARLLHDPTRWDQGVVEGGDGYLGCLKTKAKKRENITPEVCFQLQLCQVPGISTKLARALSERYGNLARMVHELRVSGREAACRCLQEVPLLGPKKAQVLYDYLCGKEGTPVVV